MNKPDPQREPRSETPDKKGIHKAHEEFIDDEARPSITKQEYEKQKREQERPPPENRILND